MDRLKNSRHIWIPILILLFAAGGYSAISVWLCHSVPSYWQETVQVLCVVFSFPLGVYVGGMLMFDVWHYYKYGGGKL